MSRLIGLAGLVVFLGIAAALSKNRRRIPIRTVLWGIGLQLVFAILILKTTPGKLVFAYVGSAFEQVIKFTDAGVAFVLGNGQEPVLQTEKIQGAPYKVALPLAFRALPVIIFFASLMGILYHLGVMQRVVAGMAWLMRRTMKVSGAEALSASGNVFLGMTESPLLIRPYVAGLTESELFAVMVGGARHDRGERDGRLREARDRRQASPVREHDVGSWKPRDCEDHGARDRRA
jgi:CNT family concentrative nucleoside transporter